MSAKLSAALLGATAAVLAASTLAAPATAAAHESAAAKRPTTSQVSDPCGRGFVRIATREVRSNADQILAPIGTLGHRPAARPVIATAGTLSVYSKVGTDRALCATLTATDGRVVHAIVELAPAGQRPGAAAGVSDEGATSATVVLPIGPGSRAYTATGKLTMPGGTTAKAVVTVKPRSVTVKPLN